MKKLMVAILTLIAVIVPISGGLAVQTDALAVSESTTQSTPLFLSESGIVTNVSKNTGDTGTTVTMEDSEGGITNFVVPQNAYSVTNTDADTIKTGDHFIGYYDATLPVILIYPPQYQAVVYAVNLPDSNSLKVDLFNDDLISSDNQLKLIIDDDVNIYTEDGKKYIGDIKGKELVVLYSRSTRSIPAQTVPEKIVVLNDRTVTNTEKEIDSITGTVTKVQKVYNKDKKAIQNRRLVTIKGTDGNTYKFLITKDTYYIFCKLSTIKVKSKFTGYYYTSSANTKQYTAIAAIGNSKKSMAKVDRFDQNRLSADGSLQISIAKSTKIVTKSGKTYTGSLDNKILAVIYSSVKETYPAQTTPSKIIVLK